MPGVLQYMVVYQFILGEINCAAFFVDGSSISNLQVKRQPHFEPVLKSVIAMTQHVVVTNVTIRDVHQAWLNGQGCPVCTWLIACCSHFILFQYTHCIVQLLVHFLLDVSNIIIHDVAGTIFYLYRCMLTAC